MRLGHSVCTNTIIYLSRTRSHCVVLSNQNTQTLSCIHHELSHIKIKDKGTMSKNAPTLMHVGAFLDLVSLAVHQNSICINTRGTKTMVWPRLMGSPKLQIIFHKRATKYRSLLQKMTYKEKGSYETWPLCMHKHCHLSITNSLPLK